MVAKKGITKRKSHAKDYEKNPGLAGAIKDLENELAKLGEAKSQLKKTIKEASGAIDKDREKEKDLQRQINLLVEKESKLGNLKKALEAKLENLSDKANKISRIKSEMADV